MGKRKIMHTETEDETKVNEENVDTSNHTEVQEKNVEQIRNEEMKQSETTKPKKVSEQEEMSYNEEDENGEEVQNDVIEVVEEQDLSTQDKEIMELLNESEFMPTPQDDEEMELKQQHLFMPDDIVSNPNRLLQFSGNNVIRIVYDSDAEEDEQQELHQNCHISPFIEGLLDDIVGKECMDKWNISPCGMYWAQANVQT